MKRILITLFGLLIIVTAQASTLKPYAGNIGSPGFSLNDLQGKTHNLKDYRGRVVLVQFWATYCTPCRTEMPSMNKMQQKLADKGFKIIAINMAEDRADIDKFVTEVKPGFVILHDKDGSVLQQWKVFAAPASFVIDQTGKIRYTLYGAVEWDSAEIINTITSLIR